MEDPGPKLILYPGRKGRPDFALRVEGGTVWLTQAEVAERFQTTKQNVSLHILNILKESELNEDSVVKESLTTAADGKNYRTKLYRLELIPSKRPVLQGPGRMSHARMKEIASERYEEFDGRRRDGRRRETERLAADDEDVNALESLAKEIKAMKPVNRPNETSNTSGEEVEG